MVIRLLLYRGPGCIGFQQAMKGTGITDLLSSKCLLKEEFHCRLLTGSLWHVPLAARVSPFPVQKRWLIKKHQLLEARVGGRKHLVPKHKVDGIAPEYEFGWGSSNTNIFQYWLPSIILLGVATLSVCIKIVVDAHVYGKKYEPVLVFEKMQKEDPVYFSYLVLAVGSPVFLYIVFSLRNVLLRLYYNDSSKDFVAVMLRYGLFKHKVHFKASDVTVCKKTKLQGNIEIKGYRVACDEKNFVNPQIFNILMGYDSSRPGHWEGPKDLEKLIAETKRRIEEDQSKQFIEKYQEKRKQKHLKKK